MVKPIDYSRLFAWVPVLVEPALVFSTALFKDINMNRQPALRNPIIRDHVASLKLGAPRKPNYNPSNWLRRKN